MAHPVLAAGLSLSESGDTGLRRLSKEGVVYIGLGTLILIIILILLLT